MRDIGFFAGALVPTFLISRVLLWITKAWAGGITRLIFVHAFSWVILSLIGGMGAADGGAFAGIKAAADYLAPQGFWLAVDLIRMAIASRRQRRAAENARGDSPGFRDPPSFR